MAGADQTRDGRTLSVVLVNHTSAISGAEVSLLDLISGLVEEHSVTLAAPEGPLARAARERGAVFEAIPAVEGSLRLHPRHTSRTLGAIAGAAWAIGRIARAMRADAIHANSFRAGLAASLAAALGAPRPLVHLHDCLPATTSAKATERALSAGAAMVLANSAYTAACFNGGRSRAPIRVVHNPIDLEAFDPSRVDRATAREELGLAPGRTVLTVLAQITPWKGQDTAIQAVRLLRDRGRDVQLLVAGAVKFRRPLARHDNDAFLRELRDATRSLGIEEAVIFTGDVPDAATLLGAVDCVLVPSWAEPWGRVVVEAMAMETPVVATTVGGTAELVEHGRNGLLAPPREPAAWADAIERLLDGSDLREQIVVSGRATARRFDRRAYVDEVVRTYRDSIALARWRMKQETGVG